MTFVLKNITALACLFFILTVATCSPATATVVELRAGQTLSIAFSLSDSLSETPDVFSLSMGPPYTTVVEPVFSLTARLFNDGSLLGEDVNSNLGAYVGSYSLNPGNSWKTAGSLWGFGTVVDFGDLFSGSNAGRIDFELAAGKIQFDTDSIYLDAFVATGSNSGGGVSPLPQIESITILPEPETWGLVLCAMACLLPWTLRRRLQRAATNWSKCIWLAAAVGIATSGASRAAEVISNSQYAPATPSDTITFGSFEIGNEITLGGTGRTTSNFRSLVATRGATGSADFFGSNACIPRMAAPAPEPSTFVLGIAGLAGLGFLTLRKKVHRV